MIAPGSDIECERVVADLLAYMTLVEKAGQLAIRPAPRADDRNDADSFTRALRDGRIGAVSGITSREQAEAFQQIAIEESRLGIPLLFPLETGSGIATILPSPLAAAASWDLDAIEHGERVIAQEAEALGANWAFSPDIRFSSPEDDSLASSSGEQLHLVSRIASARVRGLQFSGGSLNPSMLACLELSTTLTAPARGDGTRTHRRPTDAMAVAAAVISESRVGSIGFDGLAGDNRQALGQTTAFLKSPGGFDGILLSEWEKLSAQARSNDTGSSREPMPVEALVAAVENGSIALAQIDDAVARVLRAKYRIGLFSAPLSDGNLRQRSSLPTPVYNREVALNLARRSIILLRNEPELLPLGIDSGDVLVIGSAANDRRMPLGNAGGIAASVIDGLEQLGIPHKFVPGLALRESGTVPGRMIEADRMAIGMACEAAKRANTILVVMGETAEGGLGEAQLQLLTSLQSITERLVLVTLGARHIDPQIGGRPLACLLHAGQLGTMSGHAIAEVIAGEYVPSGKLPCAIPALDGGAGLPFGHGLSYADFALTDFALELGRDRIYAFADLRNVGEFEGIETVQLYIRRYRNGHVARQMHLAGFQRLALRSGERETLTFEIGANEIGEYREDGRFRVEEGRFDILLGLSSQRGLGGEIVLPAAIARAMAGAPLRPATTGNLRSA